MTKSGWWAVALIMLCCVSMRAQTVAPNNNDALLKQALRESVLVDGKQPFRLVLEIAPEPMERPHQRETPASMTGSMEVFWAAPGRYKLVLVAPSFRQTKTVDGTRVEEQDEGDFYPRWLDNFVKALLEPVPEKHMTKLLAQRMTGGERMVVQHADKSWSPEPTSITIFHGPMALPRCLDTSDRPDGITEETSVARACLDASYPWYQSTLDFTRYVSFKDFEPFGRQAVPRTWLNDIPENIFVEGKVATLEKLSKGDASAIRVKAPTAESGQMRTVFLSRKEISDRVENVPAFDWPAEDTEALEGWMILYVRTDRTGQIREAYWDSSDNYKLQDAGVQLALKMRLKPLVVDGAAVQIEGPLVIHFKTHRSEASSTTTP